MAKPCAGGTPALPGSPHPTTSLFPLKRGVIINIGTKSQTPPRPSAHPSRTSSNPLVALRRSSWPFVDSSFYSFVDFFFGRRRQASIPPPHQPSPGGLASVTLPQGGSDFAVPTRNILYTINRERCRSRLIEVGEIGQAVPSLVRAGRPRSQEVLIRRHRFSPSSGEC